MLRAAIIFFVIGLLAIVLGANNIAGVSIELGKVLLAVFVVLAILSALFGLFTGRGSRPLSILMASLLFGAAGGDNLVRADETLGEKAETAADSVKRDSNIAKRKHKKHYRDTHGRKNILKDAGDGISNTADRATHEAKKTERKVD